MDYTDIPITDCLAGNEGDMLLFALDRVHRQFAWKTGALDADQLARVHPPSKMTVAGLVKHLAFVEDAFTARAAALPLGAPWDERGWQENDVWIWESATGHEPNALYELWYGAVARSRAAWVELIADGGLDVVPPGDEGYPVNRRRRLVDLLEENLLHTGQASMLREAVDGLTGNDPP